MVKALDISVLMWQLAAIKAARKQLSLFQLFSSSQSKRFSSQKDTLVPSLIIGLKLDIVRSERGSGNIDAFRSRSYATNFISVIRLRTGHISPAKNEAAH
uniref:Uncharacterized protein n=1 Tax=Glossina pallidipes TaxID=7398 RepID=A0A1B0A9T7_GLOPL